MTEEFLQFVWKYGLFDRESLISDTGESITIANLGEHNGDSGPDFLNARLSIGNTTWAGNVEIHIRASDWNVHKHHSDKAYNTVILHVVHEYDTAVYNGNGVRIPTVKLQFDNNLFKRYSGLLNNPAQFPCRNKIVSIDRLYFDIWLNALVVERLQQKTLLITELLENSKNNWEEVFFVILARTFGFGLNALPFELTAKSIPFSHIGRLRDNLKQTEALLFGQAGFLEKAVLFNDYYESLRKDYLHLKNKLHVKPVESHLWKFLRLRPLNFPTIRLAQFASLMTKRENLFSEVLLCREVTDLYPLFDVAASAFWNDHFTFDNPSPFGAKRIGQEAMRNIIINAVIPLTFIYGQMHDREELKEKAMKWLSQLPPEKNRIVRKWDQAGIKVDTAYYSQALLQLNNTYCNRKKCLSCSIGMCIISRVS